MLGAVAAMGLAGLTWAAVRISLSAAATVAKGRIQVLASWPDTQGRVLAIVVGRLLLGAGPIGFSIALLVFTQKAGAQSPAVLWGAGLAAGAALAGLWLPLSVGLMAYLYRLSAPSRPEDHFR